MAKKKKRSDIAAIKEEARMMGLTYAEYQQRETLEIVDTGFSVPRGYRKAGEKHGSRQEKY